uniref:Poly [ADP-ribose] polymerase n=1 Tax=Anolis carolinensis TaxID=28377 RepID=G1KJA6_ANOCA
MLFLIMLFRSLFTGFFGPVSTPVLGINQMQIGLVQFQTITGDITKETTDVIVNMFSTNFLEGVSKAILEGGGPQVENECAALASQPHNGFITTQAGNLICKKIIHLAPDSNIKTQVFKVLRECEARKYTSVAFPAIGTVALPKQWEDMKGLSVKLVLLQQATQEYQDVENRFRHGCPTSKIQKIERVQNPFLWQSYQVKKQELDKKNGQTNNEKILFHGTPDSTVTPINHTGFNRSYAGKNAAAIGNGTYFAVNAHYSARDTYSKPDSNGRKYVYLARVLTGVYCVGKHGLITPPPKNTVGFDLYDSVTDDVNNPSMFVIFSDAQAYPEYLITFRK